MNNISRVVAALSVTTMLLACEASQKDVPKTSPQDSFFERLTLLCGKAFGGKLVSDDDADADMVGKAMTMHVSNCDLREIQIPFHIADKDDQWNRSRTWFITRTDGGLRLKHRHRHEDGSLDKVTNYGGDTADSGSANRQEFPVDTESIALFKTEGLEQSITNNWAVEISPPGKSDAIFAYELKRPEGPNVRNFRVEFDLSKPVDLPPPPWGE